MRKKERGRIEGQEEEREEKERREGEARAFLLVRPWLWAIRWASKLVEGGWG